MDAAMGEQSSGRIFLSFPRSKYYIFLSTSIWLSLHPGQVSAFKSFIALMMKAVSL
jgi:hypothetical protein